MILAVRAGRLLKPPLVCVLRPSLNATEKESLNRHSLQTHASLSQILDLIPSVAMDVNTTITRNQSAHVATFGLEFIETNIAISLRGKFPHCMQLNFING